MIFLFRNFPANSKAGNVLLNLENSQNLARFTCDPTCDNANIIKRKIVGKEARIGQSGYAIADRPSLLQNFLSTCYGDPTTQDSFKNL